MTVYDKAKWHLEAVEQRGGDPDDAYAPAAYFFAWVAVKSLLAEETARLIGREIPKLEARETDGIRLFKAVDGVLDSRVLSREADLFAMAYLDYRTGLYLHDLRAQLPPTEPDELSVGWRWDVFDRLVKVMDKRYLAWRSGALPDAL